MTRRNRPAKPPPATSPHTEPKSEPKPPKSIGPVGSIGSITADQVVVIANHDGPLHLETTRE